MLLEYFSKEYYIGGFSSNEYRKGYILLENINFIMIDIHGLSFKVDDLFFSLNCTLLELDLTDFYTIENHIININNIKNIDRYYSSNKPNNKYTLNIYFKDTTHISEYFMSENSERFLEQYRRFFNLKELVK